MKNCENCYYYIEYYTKSFDHFNKTKSGFCKNRRQYIKGKEVCEQWKDNEIKKETRKRISMETLENAITYIREIAQILKEENDE